ncbi:CFEM domain-containing protein [Colletotrichum plurivorum]|uniref:CFEM domain-containing protein n=1 Tax=Colletotrichum plurivorum TaxID=2175906 RepID=A0A8H6KK94_9PEZI|nr:CFEM domain-containing protein [Colletotrichum plurivorum]
MKTSVLAILAAAAGLALADNLDLPDCAKGCLNDGLQKAGCTQDNIKDCYCPKANVNELVNCVTGACKDQNDLLKAAQAAQKACPNGTGNNGNFNIPGFPGTGNNNGGGNNGGGNNGGNKGN